MSLPEKLVCPYSFPEEPINLILDEQDLEIKGKLFMGSITAAQNLDLLNNLKITAVLTLREDSDLQYDETSPVKEHMTISVKEDQDYQILNHFEECYDFVDRQLQNGKNVLVHCVAGISRSSTIVIAYIMKKAQQRYIDSYKLVKNQRSIIFPNFGFIKQLIKFDQMLYPRSSLEGASPMPSESPAPQKSSDSEEAEKLFECL